MVAGSVSIVLQSAVFVRAAGKENGSEREMNTFVHLQEEILQYFLRFPQYILFRWNVNCYGVLVKCDAEEMEDYTQRAIAQIQMNCESQNANADWYVVVGTPVERLSMLKECYDRVIIMVHIVLYPQMHVLSEETLKVICRRRMTRGLRK